LRRWTSADGEAIIGAMVGTSAENGTRKRLNFWPMILAFAVFFIVWLALAFATILLLVGVMHWKISSAAAPALGFGLLGLLGNAVHWLARRTPIPGKKPSQAAAEEFLGGRREDRETD
jgi:hypothetical protein